MRKKILSGVFTIIFILFSVSLVSAATRYVDDTGGVDTPNCLVQANPCLTINYAISQSNPGDTINVAAGTYDEQVVITKSLTVQGAGDATIIKPSSAAKLTSLYTLGTQTGALWNGKKLASIISVSNADNVIIKDLKVDGESLTSLSAGADYVVGVSYGETGGTINNIKVVNMNKIPESIRTYGVWLDAVSNSVSVEVKNSNINLYNKNGINARGAKLTVNIHDNTVTGPNTASTQYPNGIGIVSGATGTIAKNTVTYIQTPGTEYTSTGIFTYDTSGVIIEDNTISDAVTGIALSGTPSTGGTGNSFVERNIVFNCDVGIQLESPNTANNIINYNTIYDNDEAIYLSGVDPVYGDYSIGTGNEAHFNKIYNNLQGIENNNPDVIFNAENNWWGSSSGPKDLDGTTEVPPCTDNPNTEKNADGLGDSVSDNVDYCPWLTLQLTVTSPQEGNAYSSRRVLTDLSTTLIADKIEYSTDGIRFRTLCFNCGSYYREVTFSEGSNSVTFRATLGSETDSETRNFFVDSKKPKILKTLPDNGATVKGNVPFYIKYTEANLEEIILHWKLSPSGTDHPVECTPIFSGTNKECVVTVDLSDHDGQKIDYYFEVKDPANTVTSEVKTITIDVTPPVVTITSPEPIFYGERRVPVNVEVDENLDGKVAKLEYSIDGGRFSNLCINCDGYSGEKSFSDGEHTLVVKATDYAGNSDPGSTDSVTFTVDTKSPVIIAQYPKNNKYTNGTFYIKYTEINLQSVTLKYKELASPTFISISGVGCTAGKNKQCNFLVDLSSSDGKTIQYYFVVANHVDTTTSKTYTETVDTTLPQITITSPTATTYDLHRIKLTVSVNEQAKLEYSDNGGRFVRLCSKCNSYDSTRTFASGLHNLVVRATDNAGNVKVSDPVVFTVNS
jgi:hypothetical protein